MKARVPFTRETAPRGSVYPVEPWEMMHFVKGGDRSIDGTLPPPPYIQVALEKKTDKGIIGKDVSVAPVVPKEKST